MFLFPDKRFTFVCFVISSKMCYRGVGSVGSGGGGDKTKPNHDYYGVTNS